jgi:hypothetical protein
MNMPMTGSNGIFSIATEHVPGLIALGCTPVILWCGTRLTRWGADRGVPGAQRVQGRLRALSLSGQIAVIAMVIGAAVHAAIIPTHWGPDRVLAVLFAIDAVGFAGAALWTVAGRRHWQLISVAMLGGTVAGYAFYLARGWETADLVGIVMSSIELAAFFVVVLAGHSAFADPARRRRMVIGSFGGAALLLLGTAAATGAATVASASGHQGSAMSVMGKNGSNAKASTSTPPMSGMPSGGADGSGMSATQSSGTGMPNMDASGSGVSGTVPTTMPNMNTSSGNGSASMPAGSSTSAGGMPPMGNGSGSSGSPGASGGNGGSGMGGMGGGSGSSGGTLSLATDSAAGNITWPLPMGAMEPGMQMVTPNCTAEPTASQQRAAVSLVNQTVSGATPFQNLGAAKSAGYIPITPTGMPVVHYANPAYLASPQTLDAGAIESLVYANTSHGAVLVAAMYAMANGQVGQAPPMPGGCLTEWHVHTNLCFSNTKGVVVGAEHNGACPAGSTNRVTQPMLHVWLAPVTGGPLTVDASSAQITAAAAQLPVPSPPNPTA